MRLKQSEGTFVAIGISVRRHLRRYKLQHCCDHKITNEDVMSMFREIFIDNAADFLNAIVKKVITRHRHENRTSIANDNAPRDNERTGDNDE